MEAGEEIEGSSKAADGNRNVDEIGIGRHESHTTLSEGKAPTADPRIFFTLTALMLLRPSMRTRREGALLRGVKSEMLFA